VRGSNQFLTETSNIAIAAIVQNNQYEIVFFNGWCEKWCEKGQKAAPEHLGQCIIGT
jgi:hypothetical protein